MANVHQLRQNDQSDAINGIPYGTSPERNLDDYVPPNNYNENYDEFRPEAVKISDQIEPISTSNIMRPIPPEFMGHYAKLQEWILSV